MLAQPGRIAAKRVVVWAALTLVVSILVTLYAAIQLFEQAFAPELDKRSQLIGVTVREEIERALDYGVPIASIAGIDTYLAGILDDFEEVEQVTLLSVSGEVTASARRQSNVVEAKERMQAVDLDEPTGISLPILSRNTLVGELRLETDSRFVSTRLRNVALDILVVGLVSVLLTFELIIWVTASAVGKPLDRIFSLLREQAAGNFTHRIPAADAGELRRIARRLSDRAIDLAERAGKHVQLPALPQAYFVDIRLPLFIFSTATEISGAFLPLYSRDAGGPDWLSPNLAAIAPLVAYLVAIALVAPFSSIILQRIDPRRLFLLSIPLTAIAMIGVGLGNSAVLIAIWHGAMALVYALATIACQEYALRTASRGEDAQAIGSFLFVVLGGAFCGTALGGVLANRIGEAQTFFVGATLVLFAGLVGAKAIAPKIAERFRQQVADSRESESSPIGILLNARLVALMLGVSIPVNVGMAVFIWYLTPVALSADGVNVADIGRVVMLYYLMQVLAGPTVAKLADGRIGNLPLLVGGITIAGLALSSLMLWSGFWPFAIVVSLFGLGHAMCDATQYAQAIRIAEKDPRPGAVQVALSGLRLVARLSAIVGLAASVFMVDDIGYDSTIAAVGMMMLAGAVLIVIVQIVTTTQGKPSTAESAD
jgi:predicted MFS family arabinose efflux permease/HAMP domain-containing protein